MPSARTKRRATAHGVCLLPEVEREIAQEVRSKYVRPFELAWHALR